MNLKKVLGFATVAIACIASAMFAGCTNQMAGSVDSDARMVTLSLSATGIPQEYADQVQEAYLKKLAEETNSLGGYALFCRTIHTNRTVLD